MEPGCRWVYRVQGSLEALNGIAKQQPSPDLPAARLRSCVSTRERNVSRQASVPTLPRQDVAPLYLGYSAYLSFKSEKRVAD